MDLWLNMPRRGEEACGTSGMKAGINGVLSLSILDGWFDEAAEESGGWGFGDREPYTPDRDDAHAAGLYSMLEDEIVPLYYEGREQGMPIEMDGRLRKTIANVSMNFNCQRMIAQYSGELYEPAHRAFEAARGDGFARSRERVRWNRAVIERWPQVRFVDSDLGPEGFALSGRPSRSAHLWILSASKRPTCSSKQSLER